LRTQQCVELVFGELVVLCQFDVGSARATSLCGVGLFFVGLGFVGEFDPGSGRTLAACLTHASRALMPAFWVGG
jgi:hypothetical protein